MDVERSGRNTVTGGPGSARPAHAARPWHPPLRLSTAVGVALVLAATVAAAASCPGSLAPSKGAPASASLITVTPAVGPDGRTP